ncbi:MAG: hypothetical protein K2X37_14340 [Chitinophagaceae bacterium]|nr:hypothetical protein [Chitinophagaceae bacterium]
MEYIIQPLDWEELSDFEPMAQLFQRPKTIIIVRGNKKVGKTAFMLKILKYMALNSDKPQSLAYVSLGQLTPFLVSKLKADGCLVNLYHQNRVKSEATEGENFIFNMLPASVLFTDQIDALKNRFAKYLFLVCLSKALYDDTRMRYIIQSDEPVKLLKHTVSKFADDFSFLEITLTRPPYLNEKFANFGDTLLTVESI